MLTYLATYRLRSTHAAGQVFHDPACTYSVSGTTPLITVRIRDFSLPHAAARAGWRLPTIAASHGWHPGSTELVSVELVGEEASDPAGGGPEVFRGPALRLAKELCGCDEEAGRLVAAAAVVVAAGG